MGIPLSKRLLAQPTHVMSLGNLSARSTCLDNKRIRESQVDDIGRQHRQDGNVYYGQKKYHTAISCYTSAIKSYQLELLQCHPGYSKSLANRASAYMATGEFYLASNDLKEAIKAIETFTSDTAQDTREALIKYAERLVRCCLALLDGPQASSSFEIIQRLHDNLDLQSPATRDDPLFNAGRRIKFLIRKEEEIARARSEERWQDSLKIIEYLEEEINGWKLRLKSACLPRSWTCWKAESHARLGEPVKAEKVLDQCAEAEQYVRYLIACPAMEIEFQLTAVWVAISRADLSGARRILSETCTGASSDTPSDVERFLMRLETKLNQIETENTRSQSSYLSAIDQFLVICNAPILTTLGIKFETIKCEILQKRCLESDITLVRFQLCNQIITSNKRLHKFLNLTSLERLSETGVDELYRVYLVRSLIAQAHSMRKCDYDGWRSTFITISDLNDLWPDLDIPGKENLRRLADVSRSWIYNQSSHTPFNKSHPHSSQPRSSGTKNSNYQPIKDFPDPSDYYRILGIHKKASISEIKRAFRKLCLTHHPDKGGETRIFQAINLAYSVLSNPNTKLLYDQTI